MTHERFEHLNDHEFSPAELKRALIEMILVSEIGFLTWKDLYLLLQKSRWIYEVAERQDFGSCRMTRPKTRPDYFIGMSSKSMEPGSEWQTECQMPQTVAYAIEAWMDAREEQWKSGNEELSRQLVEEQQKSAALLEELIAVKATIRIVGASSKKWWKFWTR